MWAMDRSPTLLQMFMLFSLVPNTAYCAPGDSAVSPGKLRASADSAFASGDLDKAVRFLSQAIQIEPENEKNHYKRYRAHLRGKKYKEALQDLSNSISLDPQNGQKIHQRAKLFKMLGRCGDAVVDYSKLPELGVTPDRDSAEEASRCHSSIVEAERLMEGQHWQAAIAELDVAIAAAEVAPDLLHKRAQCNYELGEMYNVAADTGRAVKLDPGNIESLELRAWSYYVLGELDMAGAHFREGLKFDPEHKGCKEGHRRLRKMSKTADKGKAAADRGQHREAIEHFQAAVAIDADHRMFNTPLYVRMARCHLNLKEAKEARELAQRALDENGGLDEAYMVLGEALQVMEEWEEAVRMLRRGNEAFQGHGRMQEALKKAEIALKQSKEVNYYKVLGLERNCDTSEVKKQYRSLAKKYHPDKQAAMSGEEREKAEKEFLKVAEAYEILANDELRAKYDRGEDVSGNGQQQQQQHNPFGGFNHFGGGGGQQHFTFHFG